MAQYTFDVKVFAQVTVVAANKSEALEAIRQAPGFDVFWRQNPEDEAQDCPVSEDGEPDLLRINGEDVA